MQLIVKRYLLRASLLAGFSIFLGLGLSFLVYKANEDVKENAIDVVENRLPILSAINELIADLTEQERIIYEYYRTMEQDVFLSSSQEIQTTFSIHLQALKGQNNLTDHINIIELQQQDIVNLFSEFHQLMIVQEDWDGMRAVLSDISAKRSELLPTLKHIERVTTDQVDEGHKSTLEQLKKTEWLVSLYGCFILLIAGLVSWYIRQYIITQAKSTRLALFSQRNPNPILSVNNLGEVVFANPACGKLLACVGLQEDDIKKLLPDNFLSMRQEIAQQEKDNLVIDQTLSDRILRVSIYWHKELDAYDIHIKDVTEQVLAEQEVKQLAFTSQETQLPNQYKLKEKLDELIGRESSFSIGVIAIKQYNEKVATLGGEVVASIIRCIAKIISKNLPAGIQMYHISESEFAIIQTKSEGIEHMEELANFLSEQAEKALVTRFGEFFVECDFGFALYPEHGNDANTLLKNAHIALAIVSKNAHEKYCLFDANYAKQAEKRATMVDKLRNAILLEELFLVFQPQLCLKQQKVTGIETLVRWRHGGEIVSPVDFIPLAEESGLIVPIGKWILEQACIFAQSLVELGHKDIVIAVNVSPRQFSHPLFIDTVKDALTMSKLPAKNLELEITEGVFMHNEANTLSMMHTLKSLGVQMSIDDFGTGYSSLSYLKQFPVDKLKIDQSFVKECHQNAEDKAIIDTIIGLGKNLGLTLIAEGVEEETHVSLLQDMACDEIQGYWFSRPVEKEELVRFITQHISLDNKVNESDVKECS